MTRPSGYVISDLHLFAQRSVAEAYLPEIRAAAAEADFFVLNGDMFDFRWSVLPTVEDTVEAALEWLRDLISAHRQCRFFYILGNHDRLRLFTERLAALAAEEDNLQWVGSYLRIGTALFLHGDVRIAGARRLGFARPFRRRVRQRGRFLSACYRAVVSVGVHRLIALTNRPRRFARRILRALGAEHTGLTEGLTDVYFGHTHRPFTDYRYGGLTFHNTGSAIRGMRCNLVAVRLAGGADRW